GLSDHALFPCVLPPLPLSTLFPYTTLFRSAERLHCQRARLRFSRTADRQKHLVASLIDQSLRGCYVRSDRLTIDREHEVTFATTDRKSTRLNSSHLGISYAVFCLKKKNNTT